MWQRIQGGLVVSCQAASEMPLGKPPILLALARTVLLGGAAGLRMEGPANLTLARANLDPSVPIIGLWKLGAPPGVFITPTVEAVRAVVATGVELVALDATDRPRPDGRPLKDSVAYLHDHGRYAVGDVATAEDAAAAEMAGVDAVATTLVGYTGSEQGPMSPDYALIQRLVREVSVPVLAEGHIRTPEEARRALDAGAFAVIVGSAITRPEVLTREFVAALEKSPLTLRTPEED